MSTTKYTRGEKLLVAFGVALLTIAIAASVFDRANAQTIYPLPGFISTSSPVSAITQRIANVAVKITGLPTGQCLTLDSNGVLTTTGAACGSGGGGGASWGSITGTLSSQTDLQAALNGKLATTTTWTVGNLAQVASNGAVKSIATSSLNLATSSFASGNISQWVNDSGYLKANQTITLSGDITGSGATSITTSYNNVVPSTKGGAGSVSGILKANGSGTVSAAVSGTDYAPPTSGAAILYGNAAGGFSNATVSSPLTFSAGALGIQQASGSQSGYLSSTDWSTFNGKQTAGNYITALTGDATASGPGSAALTLASVNANVGSFTCANITANAKGLITAAASGSCGGGGGGGTVGTSSAETSGYFPYWTTTNGNPAKLAGTSTLAYLGGNIGIGLTNPTSRFEIAGTSTNASDNSVMVWDSASNPLFTVDNAGQVGLGTSSPSASLQLVFPSIGQTEVATTGVYLVNPTAATASVQQVSPALTFEGQGWKSTGTASVPVKFQVDDEPVSGGSNPTGQLNFRSSINNGGFGNSITLDSAGVVTAAGGLRGNGASTLYAISSSVGTSPSGSDFGTYASSNVNNTTSSLLIASSSNIGLRAAFNGGNSAALTANSNYANLDIGSAPVSTATTGTHPMLANLAVGALGAVTNSGASVTNTASLYIDGSASTTTVTGKNYAFYSRQGENYLGATTTIAGIIDYTGVPAAVSGNVTLCVNATTGLLYQGGSGTSCAPSTETVKTDISTSTAGIDELMALRPVTYYFTDGSETQQQIGLIAEEADVVDPRLVQKDPEGKIASIRWDDVAGLVLKAIQDIWHHDSEQDAQIAQLQQEVAQLQASCVMK